MLDRDGLARLVAAGVVAEVNQPPVDSQQRLVELRQQDRLGDRVHVALASALLFLLPVNTRLAGIAMVLVIIWFGIRVIHWPSHLPAIPRHVFLPGVVWCGFLALSALWTPSPDEAWKKLGSQIALLLVPAMWPVADRWPRLLKMFMAGLVIQATFQTIVILSMNSNDHLWVLGGLGVHPRRLGFFHAAGFLGLMAAFCTGLIRRPWWILLGVPLLLAVVVSFSRAATIAIALGTVLLTGVLLLRGEHVRRTLSVAIMTFAVAAFALFFAGGKAIAKFEQAYERVVDTVHDHRPADIRLAWWRSALRQWQQHPIVGFGLGGSAAAFNLDHQLEVETRHSEFMTTARVNHNPHSSYVQILLEGGIVGVALFTWMIGTVVFAAYRQSRLHPLGLITLGALFAWLATATTDYWYIVPHMLAPFWILATLASLDPRSNEVEGADADADPPGLSATVRDELHQSSGTSDLISAGS
jgi:O-antigen ligase